MSWQQVHGHDQVVEQLRRAVARGRLGSSLLFVGPAGTGKRTFAIQLAKSLLCQTNDEQLFSACDECSSCRQVAAGTHPDLIVVNKPKDKSFIPIELLIGDRDHRMQEGLCHDIALKPFSGGRKVAVIDDADWLNQEGANCLLKTLEEPPPKSTLILISSHQHRQLPTIQSRCQIIRFQPLTAPLVAELLQQEGLVDDPDEAQRLAAIASGSLQQAVELKDAVLREFREEFFDFLAHPYRGTGEFAKTLIEVVDEAGKDAPARRQRMHVLVDQAAEFYRHVMRALAGSAPQSQDEALRRAAESVTSAGLQDDQTAADCLERCLLTHWQISANANQATLIHAWLDDLARAC